MGQRMGDLYVISKPKEVHFSNRQNSGIEEVWHQRLGHPQKSIVQFLCTKNLIHVSSNKKVEIVCESCQLANLANYHLAYLIPLVLIFLKKIIVMFGD